MRESLPLVAGSLDWTTWLPPSGTHGNLRRPQPQVPNAHPGPDHCVWGLSMLRIHCRAAAWTAACVLLLSDTQLSRFQDLKAAEKAWSLQCGAVLPEWPLGGARVRLRETSWASGCPLGALPSPPHPESFWKAGSGNGPLGFSMLVARSLKESSRRAQAICLVYD